jgi:hypothetical protein
MNGPNKLDEARRRWGGAALVQGAADPAFLQTHRAEVLARAVALGLSPAQAAQMFALHLSRLSAENVDRC